MTKQNVVLKKLTSKHYAVVPTANIELPIDYTTMIGMVDTETQVTYRPIDNNASINIMPHAANSMTDLIEYLNNTVNVVKVYDDLGF